MMRSSEKTTDYWVDYIELKSEEFEEFFAEIDEAAAENPAHGIGIAYNAYSTASDLTISHYSSGAPLNHLRKEFGRTLQADAVFLRVAALDPKEARKEYGGGLDRFMRNLSLAILLEAPRDAVVPLQVRADFYGIEDDLVETFLAGLGFPDRTLAGSLLWPEAYAPLWQAITEAAPANAIALKTFVEGWYPAMSDTAWHGTHKSRSLTFFGYWCFEAAAAAKLYGISTHLVNDHPHFPRDVLA